MKIAFSATGKTLEDSVDPRFGRCNFFVIYDLDSKQFNGISNEDNATSYGGAGIQTAEFVANNDADIVITGHCGPKAFSALKAAGIKVFASEDCSIKKALDLYLNNQLEELKGADVQGHWS